MASLKDVEQLADDLERLVDELRSELGNGKVDFERLIQVADQISERADGFAGTFATVNEALMSRLDEIRGGASKGSQASTSSSSGSSSSESKAKSGSSS
ncbi:MAG TPA: hypothetical protein VF101_13890 [Gaiellaceae bacterium]